MINHKELLELIKQRRSVRKFKDTSIKKEDLLELVEAGIYAPSGSNSQCYRFIIVDRREDMDFLGKTKLSWIKNSPNAILVYANLDMCSYLKSIRKEVFKYLPYQDCAMAMQNILLLAEAKGMGDCIIHLSEQWKTAKEIKTYFHLKDTDELMGIIVLGYADEQIDLTEAKHANKLIKRKDITYYLSK